MATAKLLTAHGEEVLLRDSSSGAIWYSGSGGEPTQSSSLTADANGNLTANIAQAISGGFPNWWGGSATDGTDTFFADTTLFLTSIFIPVNKTLTGIGFLLGSVGGTNRVVVQLNSAAGVLLANSTLTSEGTVAGTAAQTQEIAFTSSYAAKGPAHYFIGISANGNTAKLRTVPAYRGPWLLCGSVTQARATPGTIAAPTAFAADKAPICYVY